MFYEETIMNSLYSHYYNEYVFHNLTVFATKIHCVNGVEHKSKSESKHVIIDKIPIVL